MSDSPQAADWWLAADGRWYPPVAAAPSGPPPVDLPAPGAPAHTPMPDPNRLPSRATVAVTLVAVLVIVGGAGAYYLAKKPDIRTGSIAEFCDDWRLFNSENNDIEIESTADVSRLVDSMVRDVRWPTTMVDDVEEAVDEMNTLIDDLEGVDMDSDMADRIANRADVDAFNRVTEYGDSRC